MTVLLTTRTPPLGSSPDDLPSRYAAVAAAVSHHLTPAHAALLARPEPSPTGMDWVAPEGEWRRFADLPALDRDKLLDAVAAIRSDIRRLAESGEAPVVTAAWPVMWTIPDMSYLFAVAGRPVIAGWSLPAQAGVAGAVLDRFDDAVPFEPPPRTPWTVYGLTLGVLASVALLAGLLLPFLGLDLANAPPAACTAAPGQLALMQQEGQVEAQGEDLRTLLAALTAQLGQRQLTCPLRVSRPATPPPAPTPPPRADLPEDRWSQHDLSLLTGCWRLTTEVAAVTAQGARDPFSSWKLCFGADGNGQTTQVTQSGRECQGGLTARFAGDDLVITEPEACHGTLRISRFAMHCQRVSDRRASCDGRNLEPVGGAVSPTFGAQFQR